MTVEFTPFPKMPRLSRNIVITEKINGTNASVFIEEIFDPVLADEARNDPTVIAGAECGFSVTTIRAGSRERWITPDDDNAGFAKWVKENAQELMKLGPGHHFGEWWGKGIQSGYGLDEKRFSLFNTARWAAHGTEPRVIPNPDPRLVKMQQVVPACCHVVPVLYEGPFDMNKVESALMALQLYGSVAAPGFMRPEGVIVYHQAAGIGFKKTLLKDHEPKSFPKNFAPKIKETTA